MQSDIAELDPFVAALRRGREWVERAKCAQLDMPREERLALFFPKPGWPSLGKAKAICAACPVSKECEEYAERTNSIGLWNGKVRALYPRNN